MTVLEAAKRSIAGVASQVVDLVLPPGCPACGTATADLGLLCARCWARLDLLAPPLCAIYGTPLPHELGEGSLSPLAISDPPPFRRSRSAVLHGEVSRRLVGGFKYGDRMERARPLAAMMSAAGRELLADAEILVPVPLHRRRLRARRYNQAGLLAQALAHAAQLPWSPDVVERARPTRQQVGLTAGERDRNVRGAFRVPAERSGRVAGRRVLLIDDVYTTGATVRAATRALLRAGAADVDVLTFSRVVEPH